MKETADKVVSAKAAGVPSSLSPELPNRFDYLF